MDEFKEVDAAVLLYPGHDFKEIDAAVLYPSLKRRQRKALADGASLDRAASGIASTDADKELLRAMYPASETMFNNLPRNEG